MPIDAHFHCWQLSRGDYGWLDASANPALAPICRDVAVSDWQAHASAAGIRGGVLVQAAATEAETHFLLAQAEAHASVLGVVGWVDWLAPDAPARIEALAAHQKLKGLRPMLQDIADPAWILQPALAPAMEAMVRTGLAFDALIKPVHLPHIRTLAGRYPELRIVIDHGAKPDIAAGQWQPWAAALADIALRTTALCKLSGLLTEAGPSPAPGATRRWAAHVLACFGASRTVWGSDWPVLELAGTYAGWHAESLDLMTHLNTVEQAAVMGGNARRFYRL